MLKVKNIFLKDIFQDLIDKMNADNNTSVSFYYGSPIETNDIHRTDYSADKVKLKYPFIALFLNGTDGEIRRDYNIDSDYYGTAKCWFVIMNQNNVADNTVKNTFDNVLTPVATIYENLIETIEKRIDLTIGRPSNESVIDHVKWGLVAKFQGKTSNVFAENLSGKEINFDLPIIRQTYESC